MIITDYKMSQPEISSFHIQYPLNPILYHHQMNPTATTTTTTTDITCTQCGKCSSPGNPVKCPIGPQFAVCTSCFQTQLQSLTAYKQSRPRSYPEISQILPHLYLGNQDAAIDESIIDQYQIRAVLVCGSYLMTPFQSKQFSPPHPTILYKQFQITDHYDQQILQLLNQGTQWLNERLSQGRNVLVHCAAGVSRSASFVIAYIMRYQDMEFQDGYRFVKDRRAVVKPNSGFFKQLETYGQILEQDKAKQKQGQ